MAIDSANKRASLIGSLPIPDGTLDKGDRIQCMGQYSGANVTDIYYLIGGIHGVLSAASIITPGADEMLVGAMRGSLTASMVAPHLSIGLFGEIAGSLSGDADLHISFNLPGKIDMALSARATLGIDGYNGLIAGY